ncbi:hypothetical protein L9F63_011173, partial [Diploptera punctata]
SLLWFDKMRRQLTLEQRIYVYRQSTILHAHNNEVQRVNLNVFTRIFYKLLRIKIRIDSTPVWNKLPKLHTGVSQTQKFFMQKLMFLSLE